MIVPRRWLVRELLNALESRAELEKREAVAEDRKPWPIWSVMGRDFAICIRRRHPWEALSPGRGTFVWELNGRRCSRAAIERELNRGP